MFYKVNGATCNNFVQKEDKNTAWLRQSPTDASAAFFPRPKKEPLSNCSSMLDPKKERREGEQPAN